MPTPYPLIYAAVPRIACKGKCQGSCGPIAVSARERAYFEGQTGKAFPDALKILNAAVREGSPLECPYLNLIGQCDVYQNRPLICRLWGVIGDVEAMRCPYGCVADRLLTDAEAQNLLEQAE